MLNTQIKPVARSILPIAAVVCIAALSACSGQRLAPASAISAKPLPPPPVHSNGQALRNIVNGKCIPAQRTTGAPTPCTELVIDQGPAQGHAVLKDKRGASQYLVMPTQPITGIEDARLLAPGTPNYFAIAWRERGLVEQKLGTTLPRDDVSVAVNSVYGRSQDLLHLHVDCIRADVRRDLRRHLEQIGHVWSAPIVLAGHRYRALRLNGGEADFASPFITLANGLSVPQAEMGAWTLLLAGATFRDGPGFVLLATRADPAAGLDGSAEELQDHDCVLAKTDRQALRP